MAVRVERERPGRERRLHGARGMRIPALLQEFLHHEALRSQRTEPGDVETHAELGPVVADGAHAAGLAADHGHGALAFHHGHQALGGGAALARGFRQHAGGDERTPAAAERGKHHAVAEGLQQFDGRLPDARLVVHGKAVREEDHGGRTGRRAAAACGVPAVEGRAVRGHGATDIHAEHPRLHDAHERKPVGQVGQAPDARQEAIAPADATEDRGLERHAAGGGIALRGVFGLELRDIHVGRALTLAGLAAEAEGKRLLDVGLVPVGVPVRTGAAVTVHRGAVERELAGDGKPQVVAAAARRVPFVKRGLVRGAHGDRALQPTAEPRPVAHLDRVAEPILLLVAEEGLLGLGVHLHAVGCDAQVLDGHGGARHVHLDARVHDAGRIPDGLHLRERAADGLAEVAKLERGARAARAVLAAERAAVAHHEVGDFLADPDHVLAVGGIGERKHRPDVQAADACVRVEAGLRAVGGEDRLEFLDESGKLRRVDRRVLDEPERLAQPRHAMEERLAGLAQAPRLGHALGVRVLLHRLVREALTQLAELGLDLLLRLPEVLHVHHRAELRALGARHEFHVLRVLAVGAREVDDDLVDHLDRCRIGGEHRGERRERVVHRGKAHDRQPLGLRRMDELDLRAQDGGERALGAADDVRQVHAVERAGRRALEAVEEEVEVVAVHVAQDAREARTDLLAQGPEHRAHGLGDAALGGVAVAGALLQAVHGAVGKHHVERVEVLHGAAEHDAVRAGRVVADGAGHGIVAAGGGIRREHPAERCQVSVQAVDHHAGLDPRAAAMAVDGDHLSAMRAHVEHHGLVHALAVQAGAAAARQDGHAVAGAPLHHADGLVHVAHHHRAERVHLVRAGIRGIEHAPGAVRPHVRATDAGESCGNARAGLCGDAVGFELRKRDHGEGVTWRLRVGTDVGSRGAVGVALFTCRCRAPWRHRRGAWRACPRRNRCAWSGACRPGRSRCRPGCPGSRTCRSAPRPGPASPAS